MTAALDCVVRPLVPATKDNNAQASRSVDGAFRVHLSQDSLGQLGLDFQQGDLCSLSQDGKLLCHALAWRAADKMNTNTKNRTAKMTDTLKILLGLEDNTTVQIGNAHSRIRRATNVHLVELCEAGSERSPWDEFDFWETRCKLRLGGLEAIMEGLTFDVAGKKNVQKRFQIVRIGCEDAQASTNTLYKTSESTRVIFSDDIASVSPVDKTVELNFDCSRIGGLLTQLKELKERIRLLSQTIKSQAAAVTCKEHVLLHGFEGTGKSLILDELERTNPQKVFRVTTSGVASKDRETIKGVFKESLAAQPSIIIIDDLEKIAPTDDKILAPLLRSQLLNLKSSRVMAIAATSRKGDCSSDIVGSGVFDAAIELTIPTAPSRAKILKLLQSHNDLLSDEIADSVGQKTHGFTGEDMRRLHSAASLHVHFRQPIDPIDSEKNGPLEESASQDSLPPSLRFLLSDFEQALVRIRPTALREISFETPKISWADIGGSENVSSILDEVISWPLRYPEKVAKFNYRTNKGILLYGPPGCSKTLTAQAVASTYGLNFISVKGAELISKYVGESERAVRDVFRKARQAAPCVIFFDEIDSIGAERDGSSSGGGNLNVLTTLLTEMDGFEEMKGVLVLAATNKPDILDPALLRPGRFDKHIYVAPPNQIARRAILDIAFRDVPVQNDIDFDGLVNDSDGYSGAKLVSICQTAVSEALRREIVQEETARVTEADIRRGMSKTTRRISRQMLETYERFGARQDA